jgi:energy-coupling factor transporter ATP-binding protein EcfA2
VRITQLKVTNYRTLQDVVLTFPSSYTAICGQNDSGKTNVVRVLRALIRDQSLVGMFQPIEEEGRISPKNDFPKFHDVDPKQQAITVALSLRIDKERDTGLLQAIVRQLSLDDGTSELQLDLTAIFQHSRPNPDVSVRTCARDFSGIEAQEVLKRLQTSKGIIFHNSTKIDSDFPFPVEGSGHLRAVTAEHAALVKSMRTTVNRGLKKLSQTHKRELEDILGRLSSKYSVGMSMPEFDFSSVPFQVTLGQKDFEVPLDDWGSGTKNRTLILMKLFRAKQLSESEATASKVTPVLLLEEPESFLHPAAQAEFGTVLQDLAEELKVQVIVTTHSPYLLNLRSPEANILLSRKTIKRQLRDTERVDTTGENWAKPFGLALGLSHDDLKPWKNLLISQTNALLLVEGPTDKEYFEMLRHPSHGTDALQFEGDIEPYDGTGSLQNNVLLRFVKNRHQRFFVTYDLDAEEALEKKLTGLGLEKRRHYLPVGIDAAGKRNIEGLLPASVTAAVYGTNADLVQQATSGSKHEQDEAKRRLKQLYLAEFKRVAKPGPEHFGAFYPLVKVINRALQH